MLFKYASLEPEYKTVIAETIAVMDALQVFSKSNALPEPVVTHVFRTPAQSAEIYWKDYYARAGNDEAKARDMASRQFSWHMVRCAVDLRDYIYTADQLASVLKFLRDGRTGPQWEILGHDVGSGHHLHIGFRDYPRYKEWQKSLTQGATNVSVNS